MSNYAQCFARIGVADKVTVNYYAGTSPGNQAFADYFAKSGVAANAVQTNNFLDIIPKAWNKKDLMTVSVMHFINLAHLSSRLFKSLRRF